MRCDLIEYGNVGSGKGDRRLLALASKDRLVRILEKMLDEDEFFSAHGIRSYVFPITLVAYIKSYFRIDYPSIISRGRGGWTCTDSDTK